MIEINPNNVDAWNSKGLAFSRHIGRYDEAIKSYDRVIEINPNNVDAWNSKGLAFSNQGRNDEAIKYL